MLARNPVNPENLEILTNVTIPTVRKLMIVAGEPSGDAHGAALVKALLATD